MFELKGFLVGVGGSHHTVSLPQDEWPGLGASINDGIKLLEVNTACIRPAGCLGIYRLPSAWCWADCLAAAPNRRQELTVRRLPTQSWGHMLSEILQKPQVEIHTQLVRDR